MVRPLSRSTAKPLKDLAGRRLCAQSSSWHLLALWNQDFVLGKKIDVGRSWASWILLEQGTAWSPIILMRWQNQPNAWRFRTSRPQMWTTPNEPLKIPRLIGSCRALCYLICWGIVITYSRETYQPTSIRRLDRGISNGSNNVWDY
jgi:hypothetical protein